MAVYETREEIIKNLDENGFIYGEVVLDVEDIIEVDPDEFFDLLSDALVSNDALLEIDYRPLSVNKDGQIVIGVYGNPRIVLQDLESEEELST